MSPSLVHILIAFLVLTGLVFLSVSALLNPVVDLARQAVNFLTFPMVKIFDKFRSFFSIIINLKNLAYENQILNRQVEKLVAEVANLEKAKEENRFLRQGLGFQRESDFMLIPAEIIAWDFFNLDRGITLNRGEKQGVKEGDPVVVSGNILVGVVSQAFANTSQMNLLSFSGVVVNAEAFPGGGKGIVRGEHGLGITFDLVSQTEVIKSGDRILTSGLGGQFPKNLLIGEIGNIRSSESELFQKASIIPATNLRNLRFVFVIRK